MRPIRIARASCLGLAIAWAAGAAAAPVACGLDGADVTVEPATQEATALCDLVEGGLDVLASCGLRPSEALHIVTSEAPLPDNPACLGLFHCATNTIALLEPSALEAALGPRHPYAALPVERIFGSLLVHELAHALVFQSGMQDRTHLRGEYVAYAMQFLALAPEERAAVLTAHPAGPAFDPGMLNSVVLSMFPIAFGAAAWQHFEAESDGCGFVAGLIAGEARLPGEGACIDPMLCGE